MLEIWKEFYHSYFIAYIILTLFLAMIPAQMAKDKGKDYFVWYLYGFLLWIIAFIHALCLPENNNAKQVSRETVVREKISVEKDDTLKSDDKPKNIDINSCIDIVGYELSKNENDQLYISVELFNLNKGIVKAIKFRCKGFNSFGEVIKVNDSEEFSVVVQDLHIDKLTLFTTNSNTPLPNNMIRKLELSIEQVCFENDCIVESIPYWVQQTNETTLNEYELQAVQSIWSKSNILPVQNKDYWTCCCGRPNNNQADKCLLCGANKDFIFENITSEIISEKVNEIKEKERIEKETIENQIKEKEDKIKQRKERIKKTAIIGTIVCCFVLIGLYMFALPPIRYNHALELSNDKKYDEAIEVYMKLGDYKDSEDLLTENLYQSGCRYTRIGQLENAIDCLADIRDYKDSDQYYNYAMGRKYYIDKDYGNAIIYLEKVLDFREGSIFYHECLDKIEKQEESLSD